MSPILVYGPSPLPPSRVAAALPSLSDAAYRVLTFVVRVLLSVAIETEPLVHGQTARARHYW